MNNVSLRAATSNDVAFALQVTEACMRDYAEQAWGSWDGRADLQLAFDEVIQFSERDMGLIGINRGSDWCILTSFISCRLTKTEALRQTFEGVKPF